MLNSGRNQIKSKKKLFRTISLLAQNLILQLDMERFLASGNKANMQNLLQEMAVEGIIIVSNK